VKARLPARMRVTEKRVGRDGAGKSQNKAPRAWHSGRFDDGRRRLRKQLVDIAGSRAERRQEAICKEIHGFGSALTPGLWA
jgi:hypothetical protein